MDGHYIDAIQSAASLQSRQPMVVNGHHAT
jgi:hypothetical protein